MKKRESNFELMKIISMFMIIAYHFIVHGEILENTTGFLNIIMNFFKMLFIVHVNSFVLITGYFQYNKQFKLSKVLSINNACIFYKILIPLIMLLLGILSISPLKTLQVIMPFNNGDYWFIGCYILLYLCSPFLNIIIKSINKRMHKNILLTFFIITSIISTITNGIAYWNNDGFSITNFIFLYFIGAYINKYKKNIFINIKKTKRILIIITLFILIAVINTGLRTFFIKFLEGNNELKNFVGWIFVYRSHSYCNPLVIIQSILYFLIFKNLKISSNFINKIASCTIGIYMIHDNEFIRNILYKNIFNLSSNYNNTLLYKVPYYVIITFTICLLFELVRKFIFKKLKKTKVIQYIEENMKKICFKNEINW